MTGATLIKKAFHWDVLLTVRGSAHDPRDGEHGSTQADVLEWGVLYLAGSRKTTETLGGILRIGDLKVRPPTITHLLQQSHTSSHRLWGPITFKLPQVPTTYTVVWGRREIRR